MGPCTLKMLQSWQNSPTLLAKENSFSNFRTTNLVVISFHEVLKKKQNNKLHYQLKATKNQVLETLNWGNRAVNESALMSLNWENGSLAKSYNIVRRMQTMIWATSFICYGVWVYAS